MRWSQQSLDGDPQLSLPGYRDATVRHFDAPEAIDTRFYEVRARTILNRVPESSQVPFRWTVNPYRGCTHACSYCLEGATSVMMADGSHRRIEQLEPGDRIYGTAQHGVHRRLVTTEVLDKWVSVKPAYRVLLAGGTELVASGDHRFLSHRGWKHVIGDEAGSGDRPHLTSRDQLVGVLGFGLAPSDPEARERTHRLRDRKQAIAWKGSIEGGVVETSEDLGVEAIEPLGCEVPLYDITTATGDFIANGVVSHNCFARPTHEFLDWNAGRDFEREIVVKVNAPERLRVELARASWPGEHVALGTNTDPYQWVEGRYELMRGIWEALRDARNPCSVLTKSPLLVRDLDLMRQLNQVTEFSAALSIPTLERRAWRETEPRTPNPRARLEALGELSAAGIRTGVLVAPLMPGINDSPEQVAEVVRLATEAGASYVTGIALHLRKGVREVFMEWLAEHRPELTKRYEDLYGRGAYAPPAERRRLAQLIEGPLLSPQERGWRMNGAARRPKNHQFAGQSDAGDSSPARQPEPGAPRLF